MSLKFVCIPKDTEYTGATVCKGGHFKNVIIYRGFDWTDDDLNW